MYAHSYIKSAAAILNQYDGSQPFSLFLKQFFKEYKKFGSKDRKQVAHLCYCTFRIGRALPHLPAEQRMIYALFLCHDSPYSLLEELDPELNKKTAEKLEKKIHFLHRGQSFREEEVFPWTGYLSPVINQEEFLHSFFHQPDLFLRIRPGKVEEVHRKLRAAEIPFSTVQGDSIALSNGTKVEDVIQINSEAVVQDLSSQQTLNSFISHNEGGGVFSAWDCCAASGGKSLLLYDIYPKVVLTVSDIRENILFNLKNRFEEAGIRNYRSMVFDAGTSINKEQYDLVICDAPCTGSGTWGRTPEQLLYFDESKIMHYADLQKRISVNAAASVREGRWFLYITCSVFREENEAVVDHIKDHTGLQLEEQQYHKGYNHNADTLFTALFRKL
jgi:16S rRNA (cytosine967-C5)-methyltransferase